MREALDLPAAAPRDVALHLLDLDGDDAALGDAHGVLDADELARAGRLRDPQGRRRFLLRRLHVRRILAARIGCAPAEVRYGYGPAGKPFVRGGAASFSVSHSGGHGLVAVAGRTRVGCDVETVAPGLDWRGLAAADVLTAEESRRLEAQPPDAAAALFLRLWTLKEACLKCAGDGLSVPARTVRTDADGARAGLGPVCAASLRLPPGLVGALSWETS